MLPVVAAVVPDAARARACRRASACVGRVGFAVGCVVVATRAEENRIPLSLMLQARALARASIRSVQPELSSRLMMRLASRKLRRIRHVALLAQGFINHRAGSSTVTRGGSPKWRANPESRKGEGGRNQTEKGRGHKTHTHNPARALKKRLGPRRLVVVVAVVVVVVFSFRFTRS